MNQSSQNPGIHVIRLHGPWELEIENDGLPPIPSINTGINQKIILPGEILLCDVSGGKISLTRKFGCPTGLSDGQKVWLVIETSDFKSNVYLNDEELAGLCGKGLRQEIGTKLQPRNSLRMEIDEIAANAGDSISLNVVQIEIEHQPPDL